MGKTFLINLNEHNRKITIGQEDDYTTACLLDFPYFKERFKMIATDLSKQQALYADAKNNTTNYFYLKPISRSKRTYSIFFTQNCESISNSHKFIFGLI